MKRAWLFLKKYIFEIVLVIIGIIFVKKMVCKNGDGQKRYDDKSKNYIDKIVKIEKEIKKIEKKKANRNNIGNMSNADRLKRIRLRLKHRNNK